MTIELEWIFVMIIAATKGNSWYMNLKSMAVFQDRRKVLYLKLVLIGLKDLRSPAQG